MTTEVKVKSVGDLINAVLAAFGHARLRAHWFRGHSDAGWRLVPAVHRQYGPGDELDMTSRFRLQAPTRHPNCPPSGDFARWLCLMQHFGLPTRLLDWTESPLVAAFFAITYERRDSDAAIWCLSPGDLNEATTGRASVAFLGHERVSELLRPAFVGGDSPDLAVAVAGQEVDLRMAVQQSAFTLHGGPSALENHPKADRFLRKFIIPAPAREDWRRELWLLGIRRSMLFPDIEHLARELAHEWSHKGHGPVDGSPNSALEPPPQGGAAQR